MKSLMQKIKLVCLTGMVAAVSVACEKDRLSESSLLWVPEAQDSTLLPDCVEKMENPMIDWVKIYPGEVDESEPRIASARVKISPY